jgi:hypothetical protein
VRMDGGRCAVGGQLSQVGRVFAGATLLHLCGCCRSSAVVLACPYLRM